MFAAGASAADIELMTAKMTFMASKVTTNAFVVSFLGAIPPPDGPMLLLEHCNQGTLLDWLKAVVKVTGDVEEQMNEFTQQVATGMKHLHDTDVKHRRSLK